MAQKAAKTLASRNTARLNQSLYITLVLHALFLLLRALLFRSSFTRSSLILYVLLSLPSLIIEFWFESIARPTYTTNASGTKELKRAGEDLDAKGLTEYMWDITYWSWLCISLAALFGDYAWWAWLVVPVYSAWLGYTTFTGARAGLGGLMGGTNAQGEGIGTGAQSKRQAKIEKRGGQKMVYR